MPDPIVSEIDAPLMQPGAPMPELIASDGSLTVSYFAPDDRRMHVRFTRPCAHYFGPPNDETLDAHPLAKAGLGMYRAWEVRHSRWIEELREMNRVHPHHSDARFDKLRHFIWTFHDNTFECLAEAFVVE